MIQIRFCGDKEFLISRENVAYFLIFMQINYHTVVQTREKKLDSMPKSCICRCPYAHLSSKNFKMSNFKDTVV